MMPSKVAHSKASVCRFGIVTALPKEFAAVRVMLDEPEPHSIDGDPNDYLIGAIPSVDGSGMHRVVVTLLKKTGNNTAAAAASHLIRSFPTVTEVLMVGVAGGVPKPDDVEKHVRLGDIVVSTESGVVQYDNGKLAAGKLEIRDTSQKPSAALVGKVKLLEAERLAGRRPWEAHFARARELEGAVRPSARTDRLFAAHDPSIRLKHPNDPTRRPGYPKLHYGRIGSANTLLKDPKARDALSQDLNLRAFEMEGSGIADGTWIFGQSYILVRAVSDYCDLHKNDVWQGCVDIWQGYAAVVAAAYARALIESFPAPIDPRKAEAEEKLRKGAISLDEARFESAAIHFEEAGTLAEAARDQPLERRARRSAARAWDAHVISPHIGNSEHDRVIARIHDHLGRLETLGEKPAVMAVERALVSRLEHKPEEVIRWAKEASRLAAGDVGIEIDALIARMQALWQLDKLGQAMRLAGEIERVRKTANDKDDVLTLEASWLRTRCRAGKVSTADVDRFVQDIRLVVEKPTIPLRRVAVLLGEVAAEFNRAGETGSVPALCELGFELAENLNDASMAASIALQIGELAAESGDAAKASLFLGRAKSWSEKAKDDKEPSDSGTWVTLRAVILFGCGRILARMGGQPPAGERGPNALLAEARNTLSEAKAFAIVHQSKLRGDVEIFVADVAWWLGRVCVDLGRFDEAAAYFREARSDAAMAHPGFAKEVGVPAWFEEANACRLGGDVERAQVLLDGLLEDQRPSERLKARTAALNGYLRHRVRPVLDWLNSEAAQAISRASATDGLRQTVAKQVAPLVAWWRHWHRENGPESELLDFWGRGGFARVAAAVRGSPVDAIAVDARNIGDIERWARIFCPLFDTVIIKWKGELGSGLVITPVHAYYGEGDDFGGHGYSVCAGDEMGDNWHPAFAWANPLPQNVSAFLASKALPLVESGRLVLVPAPLVGCTQHAIGWTDTLLVDNFLRGVVSTAGRREAQYAPQVQRIVDLTEITVPYVDNVDLLQLDEVLNETDEWLRPLRSLLYRSISGNDLKIENWGNIAALRNDIRDACALLQHEMKSHVAKVTRGEWHLGTVQGTFSAGTRAADRPGKEPVTDLLRCVTQQSPELAPWIPYWRLQEVGGYLNWTGKLDNPTKSPKGRKRKHCPRKMC